MSSRETASESRAFSVLRAREKKQEGRSGETSRGARSPPIPEGSGGARSRARRKDLWRSVLTHSCRRTSCLARCRRSSEHRADPEAKLYYSTMVQVQSRHTEAWLKLLGEVARHRPSGDPHLDHSRT